MSQVRSKLRYQKVMDLVEGLIAERGLAPGSMLPTQRELAEMSGVSLITVRRALDELQREGRVAGHQGVGTFVARPRLISEPARSGGLLGTLAENGTPRSVSCWTRLCGTVNSPLASPARSTGR